MALLYDFIVLDATHFLVVGLNGVIRTTKSVVIKHSLRDQKLSTICLIDDSVYFLNNYFENKLIVWNEQTDEQLFYINTDYIHSIRRVRNTYNFIMKTE
jgi:hypothetical protein